MKVSVEERPKSAKAFERLCEVIPGGVNSGARAFKGLDMTPIIVESARGDTVTDIDGHEYLDFHAAFGAILLGHSHEAVLQAVRQQTTKGLGYGSMCLLEEELARKVVEYVPSIDQVRFVNSGTEATMSALRLARGFTGRKKIVKFGGCYHGHADYLLVEAGSGVANLQKSSSAGVADELVASTISLPYNDVEALKETFAKWGEEIAAVIVEPIGGNMGVVPGTEAFLLALREETKRAGSVLIFDEVISGFRVALGGAQELFGITPDMTCLGKIVGGGFSVGAFGGRREIMAHLYPEGPVYQAGTLAGNPIASAAGLATLGICSQPGFYQTLQTLADRFTQPIIEATRDRNACLQQVGSMFTLFLGARQIRNFADAQTLPAEPFKALFHTLFANGIYIPPSRFETWFISSVHRPDQLDRAQSIIIDCC